MQKPPTADTPESWGAASRGYADKVAPALMRAYTDEFVDRLNPDSNAQALEVGAGSGALTEPLSQRVESVLATDFAPEMVEILEQRMQAIGADNVTCRVMDGQALELEDHSFDVAACSFALMLFPDRAKGFSELSRVLRPGGRAVVSGWASPDKFESFGLFLSAMKAAFPELPPPDSLPVFSLANLPDFKAQMETGGFSNVEVEYVSREFEIESFDKMWSMLTIGAPPVKVLFDRVGLSGRDRLHDSLAQIIEERYGSGPIAITNVATLGSGTAA